MWLEVIQENFWRFILGFALIAVIFLGMCVQAQDTERPRRAVEASGFRFVTVRSGNAFASWHGCGSDDAISYTVDAVNVQGEKVRLLVCCGFLKSCTVRIP